MCIGGPQVAGLKCLLHLGLPAYTWACPHTAMLSTLCVGRRAAHRSSAAEVGMLRATPFSPDRKYGIDSCSQQHSCVNTCSTLQQPMLTPSGSDWNRRVSARVKQKAVTAY